jgi:hypothetical protein
MRPNPVSRTARLEEGTASYIRDGAGTHSVLTGYWVLICEMKEAIPMQGRPPFQFSIWKQTPVRKSRVQLDSDRQNPRPTASKIAHFMDQFGGWKPVKPTASTGVMERAMGIEPNAQCGQVAESTSSLWSAGVQ